MKPTFSQMDSMELKFKEIFEHTDKACFIHPMSYSEFELLDPSIKAEYGIMRKHHRNTETGTAYNVFNNEDEFVEVVRHVRYSFPIFHNHEFVELIYVYNGSCMHFIEDQEFQMVTGDICILAPNTLHALSVTDDSTTVINVLISQKLFDESFLKMIQRVPILSHFFDSILYHHNLTPYILYPTGTDRWLHELIYHMYMERSDKGYLYNDCITQLVRQIFIHILRHYEISAQVADPISHEPNDTIVLLIGYITVNAKHITLDETAAFFGYNKNYLSQLLKKYTGQTFSTLANEIAMKQAAQLLLNNDLSISTIAQEYGCYDDSHFIRKFSKVFHMSPSEYRKINNNTVL